MGQDDFAADFAGSPRPEKPYGIDDVGPAKGTRGINLSVENPFLTIWIRPRATIRGIVDTNPGHRVLLLAALGGVVNMLDRAITKNPGDTLPLAVILLVCFVLGVIFGLIGIYVFGAFLKWTGSWIGGRATQEQVRAALAWGSVPSVATLAIWIPEFFIYGNDLFSTNTPRIEASPALAWLLILLSAVEIVLLVWSIFTSLKCLGEVHEFSAWRALGSLLLMVVAILIPILIFIGAVAFLVMMMPR